MRNDHTRRLEKLETRSASPRVGQGPRRKLHGSRSKLVAYKRIVDIFFENKAGFSPFEFHALAVDTHQLRDGVFNHGSRSIGFNKEIYQLCMKFGRLHKRRLMHIYPDHRETDQSPEELRVMLNRGIRTKGDKRDWPFRRVHFRDSASLQVLQLVDVLLGGIAFRLNGHRDRAEASPAKTELSDYILSRGRVFDVTRDTAVTGKFTLWHRVLR